MRKGPRSKRLLSACWQQAGGGSGEGECRATCVLRVIVDDLRSQGIASVHTVAADLNARGILTPRVVTRQQLGR
jgi:hypothetical protein